MADDRPLIAAKIALLGTVNGILVLATIVSLAIGGFFLLKMRRRPPVLPPEPQIIITIPQPVPIDPGRTCARHKGLGETVIRTCKDCERVRGRY